MGEVSADGDAGWDPRAVEAEMEDLGEWDKTGSGRGRGGSSGSQSYMAGYSTTTSTTVDTMTSTGDALDAAVTAVLSAASEAGGTKCQGGLLTDPRYDADSSLSAPEDQTSHSCIAQDDIPSTPGAIPEMKCTRSTMSEVTIL